MASPQITIGGYQESKHKPSLKPVRVQPSCQEV